LSTERNIIMNSKYTIVFTILFFMLNFSCNQKQNESLKDSQIVFKVNNTSVAKQEYGLFMNDQKALTYNYFYKKFGVTSNPKFWTTSLQGEMPLQYIKLKTNEELIPIKVIQDYASKIGLTPQFSFKNFLKQWDLENSKRQSKHASGKIIYGPIQIGKKEYYDYLQTNLELRLKDKLKTTTLLPTITALKQFYNSIKNTQFSYVDTMHVAYLQFPYKTSSQRKRRLKEAKKIFNALNKDKPFKALHMYRNSDYYQNITFYDSIKNYGEENTDRDIKAYAEKLQFGDIQFVDTQLETNSNVYIVSLTSPHIKKIREFEIVKNHVSYLYIEQKYEDLLDSLKTKANIQINKEVYKNIKVMQ